MSGVGAGKTVLLVEDDLTILTAVRLILEGAGYTVLPARTAHDAVRVHQQHPGALHLLLADVSLPDGRGENLAGRLGGAVPGLAVLLMTGGGDPQSAHPWIAKPFRVDDLLEQVREALGRHGTP
jgi:DNA-binding NtrC family response regulator